MLERADEPPSDCPRCAALEAALQSCTLMLAGCAADGYNLDLDVSRWARRHHAVVSPEWLDPRYRPDG